MIPIGDTPGSGTAPIVTWLLIVLCILAFVAQLGVPQNGVFLFGFIPAVTFGYEAPAQLAANPGWPTIFTSMFMHGGIMHIAGNMLYLWVFGDNIERALGKVKFLLFYLASGVAAAMAQAVLNPASFVPMVGASGAISGVLGAYLVLFPHQRVRVLTNQGLMEVPASTMLVFWFGYQLLLGILAPSESGVAFWAHIGGFAFGWIAIRLLPSPRQNTDKPRFWG